jgi:hypothetical protein
VTATIPGSIYKEPVTASAGALHIVPNNFHIVLSHQHRLWFADQSNLSVFYLPLQQKSGEVAEIPMNAIFKRGGSIRALYTWSIDGGAGMEDQLVIFTSNGEVAIYGGIDPESDMTLVGVFRFDSPMSKHCVANWGGELWVLCNTGLIPLSTMIRAESEKLGKTERNVVSIFETISQITRKTAGWSVLVDHSSGRVICNMPVGSVNTYRQMVRLMLRPVWSMWASVPARCWAWVDNRLFFGSDTGKFCEMAPIYLSDANTPIRADVQCAWSAFKTSAIKQFKMVLPYTITDGVSKPYVDFRVDYDERAPINQPDVTFGAIAAMWDTAMWDVDYWSIPNAVKNNWSGVAAIGRVGAPRLTVLIVNCKYSITGWDVLYESGSVFG